MAHYLYTVHKLMKLKCVNRENCQFQKLYKNIDGCNYHYQPPVIGNTVQYEPPIATATKMFRHQFNWVRQSEVLVTILCGCALIHCWAPRIMCAVWFCDKCWKKISLSVYQGHS